MDFYATLGIPVDADQETIRGAYRVLARQYHPDMGTGSSLEKFRQIAEAYETLIDPARRRGYDLSISSARRAFVAIRFQPAMKETPEPLRRQEDPSVFGRFQRDTSSVYGASCQPQPRLDEFLDRLMHSLESDGFFGPDGRW